MEQITEAEADAPAPVPEETIAGGEADLAEIKESAPMTDEPGTSIGTPTPEELREQVERTRDGLGQPVEALAGKAAAVARARGRTTAVRQQAVETTALVTGQIQAKARQAAHLVKDRTPDRVRDRAAQASGFLARAVLRAGQATAEKTPDPVLYNAGRAARAARAQRTPLLAAGAALAVFVLVRRGRGRR
ncbi:hypothetical protein ACFVFI_08330 [Streptomyces sp. NPDC057705]|uniref:hypothetical protein n=1 Tax=Streptomyces sp. NPDC057705 TaxID=3346222 RepID=UPI0036BE236E